jgi:hypothetical protein
VKTILLVSAAALLLLPACQSTSKYKKMSSGKFDEWSGYEGKNFKPSHGIDTAIDLNAQTITIAQDDVSKVYPVTSSTRIMHDGDDITLAELPLNQQIRFTLEEDHQHLASVWYGTHTNAWVGGAGSARRH